METETGTTRARLMGMTVHAKEQQEEGEEGEDSDGDFFDAGKGAVIDDFVAAWHLAGHPITVSHWDRKQDE